jgi:hypothetical protein
VEKVKDNRQTQTQTQTSGKSKGLPPEAYYTPPKRAPGAQTLRQPEPGPIPPCNENDPIPEGATCQEASMHSRGKYIACGVPAVTIVRHDKDRRSYYMCGPCADHNVRNRGGKYVIEPKPSAAGLRFDELPMTSTFSRADMDEATRLMTEDLEYGEQEKVIQAERAKGKARLTELARKYHIPGMRHGQLEVRLYTESRDKLDKGLFVELGGDIDILKAAYKKGKEYVKVVVSDTSKKRQKEDSEE